MENSAHGYTEGSEPTLKEEIERLESENERLRQAYKYIHASRNNVDEELNNLQKELASLKEEIKQERKNAINEAISTIGFMLGKMTYAEVIEKFESELEKLK